MFENPRRGRQARNFTTNVPKIVDRKSSSEQIFSENCGWVPLFKAQCLRSSVMNKTVITLRSVINGFTKFFSSQLGLHVCII